MGGKPRTPVDLRLVRHDTGLRPIIVVLVIILRRRRRGMRQAQVQQHAGRRMVPPRSHRINILLELWVMQVVGDQLPRQLHIPVRVQHLHHHQADGDRIDAAAAVGNLAGPDWVHAAHERPAGPAALNGFNGGDEDAVHIEQDTLAADEDGGRGFR